MIGFMEWFFQIPQGAENGGVLVTKKFAFLGWLALLWQWFLLNVNLQGNPVFLVFTFLWFLDMILGTAISFYYSYRYMQEFAKPEASRDLQAMKVYDKERYTGWKTFKGLLKWALGVIFLLIAWAFSYDGKSWDDIITTIVEMAVVFHVGMSVLGNAVHASEILSPNETASNRILRKALAFFQTRGEAWVDSLTTGAVDVRQVVETKIEATITQKPVVTKEVANEPDQTGDNQEGGMGGQTGQP